MAELGVANIFYGNLMTLPDVSRVLACLYEKNIPYKHHDISKEGRYPVPEDFLKHQGNNRITGPVFVDKDGETTLADSRAICRYVCEKYPNQGNKFLLGKEPLERASVEQWLKFEQHSFDPPSWKLVMYLACPQLKPDHMLLDENERKLAAILNVYDDRLSDREYLAGKDFTLADLSHLPNSHYLSNSREWSYLFSSRKHVWRWLKRISQRYSWQEAQKILGMAPPARLGPDTTISLPPKPPSRQLAQPPASKMQIHSSLEGSVTSEGEHISITPSKPTESTHKSPHTEPPPRHQIQSKFPMASTILPREDSLPQPEPETEPSTPPEDSPTASPAVKKTTTPSTSHQISRLTTGPPSPQTIQYKIPNSHAQGPTESPPPTKSPMHKTTQTTPTRQSPEPQSQQFQIPITAPSPQTGEISPIKPLDKQPLEDKPKAPTQTPKPQTPATRASLPPITKERTPSSEPQYQPSESPESLPSKYPGRLQFEPPTSCVTTSPPSLETSRSPEKTTEKQSLEDKSSQPPSESKQPSPKKSLLESTTRPDSPTPASSSPESRPTNKLRTTQVPPRLESWIDKHMPTTSALTNFTHEAPALAPETRPTQSHQTQPELPITPTTSLKEDSLSEPKPETEPSTPPEDLSPSTSHAVTKTTTPSKTYQISRHTTITPGPQTVQYKIPDSLREIPIETPPSPVEGHSTLKTSQPIPTPQSTEPQPQHFRSPITTPSPQTKEISPAKVLDKQPSEDKPRLTQTPKPTPPTTPVLLPPTISPSTHPIMKGRETPAAVEPQYQPSQSPKFQPKNDSTVSATPLPSLETSGSTEKTTYEQPLEDKSSQAASEKTSASLRKFPQTPISRPDSPTPPSPVTKSQPTKDLGTLHVPMMESSIDKHRPTTPFKTPDTRPTQSHQTKPELPMAPTAPLLEDSLTQSTPDTKPSTPPDDSPSSTSPTVKRATTSSTTHHISRLTTLPPSAQIIQHKFLDSQQLSAPETLPSPIEGLSTPNTTQAGPTPQYPESQSHHFHSPITPPYSQTKQISPEATHYKQPPEEKPEAPTQTPETQTPAATINSSPHDKNKDTATPSSLELQSQQSQRHKPPPTTEIIDRKPRMTPKELPSIEKLSQPPSESPLPAPIESPATPITKSQSQPSQSQIHLSSLGTRDGSSKLTIDQRSPEDNQSQPPSQTTPPSPTKSLRTPTPTLDSPAPSSMSLESQPKIDPRTQILPATPSATPTLRSDSPASPSSSPKSQPTKDPSRLQPWQPSPSGTTKPPSTTKGLASQDTTEDIMASSTQEPKSEPSKRLIDPPPIFKKEEQIPLSKTLDSQQQGATKMAPPTEGFLPNKTQATPKLSSLEPEPEKFQTPTTTPYPQTSYISSKKTVGKEPLEELSMKTPKPQLPNMPPIEPQSQPSTQVPSDEPISSIQTLQPQVPTTTIATSQTRSPSSPPTTKDGAVPPMLKPHSKPQPQDSLKEPRSLTQTPQPWVPPTERSSIPQTKKSIPMPPSPEPQFQLTTQEFIEEPKSLTQTPHKQVYTTMTPPTTKSPSTPPMIKDIDMPLSSELQYQASTKEPLEEPSFLTQTQQPQTPSTMTPQHPESISTIPTMKDRPMPPNTELQFQPSTHEPSKEPKPFTQIPQLQVPATIKTPTPTRSASTPDIKTDGAMPPSPKPQSEPSQHEPPEQQKLWTQTPQLQSLATRKTPPPTRSPSSPMTTKDEETPPSPESHSQPLAQDSLEEPGSLTQTPEVTTTMTPPPTRSPSIPPTIKDRPTQSSPQPQSQLLIQEPSEVQRSSPQQQLPTTIMTPPTKSSFTSPTTKDRVMPPSFESQSQPSTQQPSEEPTSLPQTPEPQLPSAIKTPPPLRSPSTPSTTNDGSETPSLKPQPQELTQKPLEIQKPLTQAPYTTPPTTKSLSTSPTTMDEAMPPIPKPYTQSSEIMESFTIVPHPIVPEAMNLPLIESSTPKPQFHSLAQRTSKEPLPLTPTPQPQVPATTMTPPSTNSHSPPTIKDGSMSPSFKPQSQPSIHDSSKEPRSSILTPKSQVLATTTITPQTSPFSPSITKDTKTTPSPEPHSQPLTQETLEEPRSSTQMPQPQFLVTVTPPPPPIGSPSTTLTTKIGSTQPSTRKKSQPSTQEPSEEPRSLTMTPQLTVANATALPPIESPTPKPQIQPSTQQTSKEPIPLTLTPQPQAPITTTMTTPPTRSPSPSTIKDGEIPSTPEPQSQTSTQKPLEQPKSLTPTPQVYPTITTMPPRSLSTTPTTNDKSVPLSLEPHSQPSTQDPLKEPISSILTPKSQVLSTNTSEPQTSHFVPPTTKDGETPPSPESDSKPPKSLSPTLQLPPTMTTMPPTSSITTTPTTNDKSMPLSLEPESQPSTHGPLKEPRSSTLTPKSQVHATTTIAPQTSPFPPPIIKDGEAPPNPRPHSQPSTQVPDTTTPSSTASRSTPPIIKDGSTKPGPKPQS